jgi:hypothetical protein
MTIRHLMSRPRRAAARTLALLALALVASGATASAADLFYNTTLGLDVSDDARIFLNLTNQQFAPSNAVATRVVQRCPRPENDFPVILFLARASRRSPDQVLDLWLTRLSWAEIMYELKVPPAALFAGLDRDPGPPYGKAWGRYKQHRGKGKFVIADRDVAELVKLQITARHYQVSPYRVIAERQKGVRVEQYAADRWRAKHGRPEEARDDRGPGASRGQGRGPKQKPKDH